MKTRMLCPLFFLILFYTNVYSGFRNKASIDLFNFTNISYEIGYSNKVGFNVGPTEQRIIISLGGNAIFQLFDLDGSQNVRIEAKAFGLESWQTIQGFESISSKGTYTKTTQQIYDIFGIGIFLWRVVDNSSFNHASRDNLLIILL